MLLPRLFTLVLVTAATASADVILLQDSEAAGAPSVVYSITDEQYAAQPQFQALSQAAPLDLGKALEIARKSVAQTAPKDVPYDLREASLQPIRKSDMVPGPTFPVATRWFYLFEFGDRYTPFPQNKPWSETVIVLLDGTVVAPKRK